MANRHMKYSELIAKQWIDPDYAKEYIQYVHNEEGLSLVETLREAIKSMSLSAFSKKSGEPIQSVSDFVHKRKTWSHKKVSNLIEKTFGLKVKIYLESA